MLVAKLLQRMVEVRDAAEEAVVKLVPVKVSDEIQQYRYNICKSCDKLYKPTDSCKMCGCFMKVKTWMPQHACPIKKWPAVEQQATDQ